MSIGAKLFGVYLRAGLGCLVFTVASRGKEKRAEWFDFTCGGKEGAALLLLAAILWPFWLLIRLFRSND